MFRHPGLVLRSQCQFKKYNDLDCLNFLAKHGIVEMQYPPHTN